MKAKDVRKAMPLVEAISGLPKVRRRLRDKPGPFFEGFTLELSASEMQDGDGQGSEAYVYLPIEIGEKVCDYALQLMRDEAKRLGVTL